MYIISHYSKDVLQCVVKNRYQKSKEQNPLKPYIQRQCFFIISLTLQVHINMRINAMQVLAKKVLIFETRGRKKSNLKRKNKVFRVIIQILEKIKVYSLTIFLIKNSCWKSFSPKTAIRGLDISKSLLTSIPGSMLEANFSGRHEVQKVDDKIFVDRDPEMFRHLIRYLENGQ